MVDDTNTDPNAHAAFDVEIVQVFDAPRERLFQAFTDPDLLVRWYGPPGFPVPRHTVELDPRAGGPMRFTMVSEADPSVRTGVDGRFTEVVPGELVDAVQEWDGVPGQDGPWTNRLRVELTDGDAAGTTQVVLREGPHPPGTADIGHQAWQMMFAQLADALKS